MAGDKTAAVRDSRMNVSHMTSDDSFRRSFNSRFLDVRLAQSPDPAHKLFSAYLMNSRPLDEHLPRFVETFRALVRHFSLQTLLSSKILEVGHLSPMSQFLREQGGTVSSTTTDLRSEIDAESDGFDLVFAFEVVEHLKDQPEKTFDEIVLFQETGIRKFAAECSRVVKAGGHLVLTTPNPCSLLCLQRLLKNEPPAIFRPHVREYTKAEILHIFQPLSLTHYETFSVFGNFEPNAAAASRKLFTALSADPEDRGDDQFMIFERPQSGA